MLREFTGCIIVAIHWLDRLILCLHALNERRIASFPGRNRKFSQKTLIAPEAPEPEF